MFDDVAELYQTVILDRGRHPRHGRRPDSFDASGTGENRFCGDRVQVFVRRAPGGGVAEIGFEARGCAICTASADLMAEAASGLTAPDVADLADRVRRMVQDGDTAGVPDLLHPLSGVHEHPSRTKCVTLPWDALNQALRGEAEA